MTTATAEKKQSEKTITEILAERPKALVKLAITLEEFTSHVKVTYDDRWNFYDWRVQGDAELYYWIYDCHSSRDKEKLTDAQVIERAFNHLRAIQSRSGQINCHSVYVEDCEDVELLPRRGLEHATVRVVKDRVDGLYRHSTDYWCGSGGGSSAPSMRSEISETRTDAILKGAREILATLTKSWQAKDEPQKYNPFINKLKDFIETVEDQIRQPSLFG